MASALNVISQVLQVVGALAIVAAAYTYVVHRKQLNFSVMVECTRKFQDAADGMGSSDAQTKAKAQKRYVDLCNEQLFYFQARYLPDAVVDEWLDGMIDYLPQVKARGEANAAPLVHPEPFRGKHAVDSRLLAGYPRIREAFLVDGEEPYDLDDPEARQAYVGRIKRQIPRDGETLELLADALRSSERRLLRFFRQRTSRQRKE